MKRILILREKGKGIVIKLMDRPQSHSLDIKSTRKHNQTLRSLLRLAKLLLPACPPLLQGCLFMPLAWKQMG